MGSALGKESPRLELDLDELQPESMLQRLELEAVEGLELNAMEVLVLQVDALALESLGFRMLLMMLLLPLFPNWMASALVVEV